MKACAPTITTADRIQALLGLRRMTRQDLAVALAVDRGRITKYLNGTLNLAGSKGAVTVATIAAALGVLESSLRYGSPCPHCSRAVQ